MNQDEIQKLWKEGRPDSAEVHVFRDIRRREVVGEQGKDTRTGVYRRDLTPVVPFLKYVL
ncbi:MAG TPA: hypothetical protein PKM50_03685 [Methanoregula sp.]|nr:hypothetical protein [Methanoregula sp.]